MSPQPADPGISGLLQSAAGGDRRAAAELLPLVYQELRRLAQRRMRQASPGGTLQATALVHEAYLRLIGKGDPGWNGRAHFFGAAARAMRDILVDQARRKAAMKRGGGVARDHRAVLDEIEISFAEPAEDLVALDAALCRLESRDPEKARIVMLRYFSGLSGEETAAALGVSERTIEREWRYAKAWLRREIASSGEGSNDG